jgi:hypothetical protein
MRFRAPVQLSTSPPSSPPPDLPRRLPVLDEPGVEAAGQGRFLVQIEAAVGEHVFEAGCDLDSGALRAEGRQGSWVRVADPAKCT